MFINRYAQLIILSSFLILSCSSKKDYNIIDAYNHIPETSTHGISSSKNIQVREDDDHKLVMKALSDSGHIASIMDFSTGRVTLAPDALNSRNIKVVINSSLGYTTFVGLKFKQETILNIWEDGTIEVDREGITAEDEFGIKYISAEIEWEGGDYYLMFQEEVDFNSPIEVVQAKRTLNFNTYTVNYTKYNCAEDEAILFLELSGTTVNHAAKLEEDDIYLLKGDKKHEVFFKELKITGEEKNHFFICSSALKDDLEFELHIKNFPAIEVVFEDEVSKEIKWDDL